MANHVSIRGFVSSEFEMRNTPTGLVIGSFRMGSTERRQDPITKLWEDGQTNWYRVNAFKALALNAASSIHKGDRILVMGRLKIQTFLRKDGTTGTSVDIDADGIGPDLQFGMAHYTRMAGAHPVGQSASRADAGEALQSADSFLSADEGDLPDDSMPGADGADEEQDDDVDGDAAAAAVYGDNDESGSADDESGLTEGERADRQTGEILQEAAPF
ncbi:single-stranded DNA-binding protein [Arthrobacter sp.]|uniref:single-stranded DNA-binding protein n=1 Tax=Arthrobacter sp. TaxID=1667 RepID=UPI0026DFEEB8|nr:single-stranded DNA-binding protein [Arthrobacter sp.]MDO5753773.1 single-stranded DNA-binding protein [Arthrobacter sp.]